MDREAQLPRLLLGRRRTEGLRLANEPGTLGRGRIGLAGGEDAGQRRHLSRGETGTASASIDTPRRRTCGQGPHNAPVGRAALPPEEEGLAAPLLGILLAGGSDSGSGIRRLQRRRLGRRHGGRRVGHLGSLEAVRGGLRGGTTRPSPVGLGGGREGSAAVSWRGEGRPAPPTGGITGRFTAIAPGTTAAFGASSCTGTCGSRKTDALPGPGGGPHLHIVPRPAPTTATTPTATIFVVVIAVPPDPLPPPDGTSDGGVGGGRVDRPAPDAVAVGASVARTSAGP